MIGDLELQDSAIVVEEASADQIQFISDQEYEPGVPHKTGDYATTESSMMALDEDEENLKVATIYNSVAFAGHYSPGKMLKSGEQDAKEFRPKDYRASSMQEQREARPPAGATTGLPQLFGAQVAPKQYVHDVELIKQRMIQVDEKPEDIMSSHVDLKMSFHGLSDPSAVEQQNTGRNLKISIEEKTLAKESEHYSSNR